ncbi:MAG: MFS transporter [Candidatus Taylorbacteria bacterium]|nr:MFS transporter [Candidatus Taylorbacteria bacterium]
MKHGLNLFEVNLVNTSFFITLFVCEIPTGAFADIFGRKASFVLACALISVSMFVYGSSSNLWGFVLAEVICAIGFTFRSGAFQAWLVDSLKHHGYDGDLTRIFARENLICQIGGGCGAIAGSYIYAYDPAWPWFSGGAGLLIVAVIAQVTMKEEYFVRRRFHGAADSSG